MSRHSFMMATENGWLEELIFDWRQSGKEKAGFFWWNTRPQTLQNAKGYWLYFYYSERATTIPELRGTIPYRAWVDYHDFEPITDSQVCWREGVNPDVSFVCSRIEELRKESGDYVRLEDFSHLTPDLALASALIATTPPVKRLASIVSIQVTSYQWIE
jgi:hypothetical protein